MPDYPKGKWSRREAIGLAASAIAVAGCGPASRDEKSAAAVLSNQTTVLGAGDAGGGALRLASLKCAGSKFEWLSRTQVVAPLIGNAQSPPAWSPVNGAVSENLLELKARRDDGLQSELAITAYADTGAYHWQQNFRNTGSASLGAVSEFGVLELELRGDIGDLVVHCVRRNSDYYREALPFRGHLEVKGGGWNAPSHAGLLVLEAVGHAEFLVIGVQLERDWSFTLDTAGENTRLRVNVSGREVDLAAGQALEGPTLYIGATRGSLDDAINLSLAHLGKRVMPPVLKNWPWVGYDIWSTDGRDVEKNIHDEIAFSAQLGIDLFYLDASWYKNSSRLGTGDWGKGIGSYQEDRVKFPKGLRHLSDQVHAAGMKFGLWVGPNIVDVDLVGKEIPEQWLAYQDGKRRELKIGSWQNLVVHACLGCTDYAEHLKKELTRLVGEYGLDWLKWDNSGLPGIPAVCTRGDHGHAPGEGSAAALANEYAIFRHLHETFPDLTLEQCGYGSRLDYGRAAYVRANWCSDKTFPSDSVRSNAMACGTVFPSACNAAWIVREDKEFFSYKETHEIDAGIRSRMLGLFGVGTLNGQMSQRVSLYPENVLQRLKANIATYKQFRHLLSQQISFPFQPYGRSPQGWDAAQFTDASGSEAVVICFRGTSSQATSVLPLGRLQADRTYLVRRVDAGGEESITGARLMKSGVLVELPRPGSSEILQIKAQS